LAVVVKVTMKTVLITGSEGFVGRNLRAHLQQRKELRVLCFDLQDDPEVLDESLGQADFVFHLAGVNRPVDPAEFTTGNTGLTEQICRKLLALGRPVPLLLTSSTQAALENPYGASKRQAEVAVAEYGRRSGAAVYLFRMPNVFGKWCRPNYNSAVATFCNNIAHGLPIVVNDPKVMLDLVYIDDVLSAFADLLQGQAPGAGEFCRIEPVHRVQLGDIVTLLEGFQQGRAARSIPDLADPFQKKLYSTFLSYLPQDRFSYPLTMNLDERGSFTEFIKTPDRGQVSVNISRPGITKGNHWHHTKIEKFLVVSGQGVIRFRKVGTGQVLEYPVTGDKLEVVDIPAGYTHNISNTGKVDLVTVMWCNEPFDPQRPDTFYEPV
jgi:UDP-2-acetamido-2,6-beta-L-arabino-hexul-4-ose reductase